MHVLNPAVVLVESQHYMDVRAAVPASTLTQPNAFTNAFANFLTLILKNQLVGATTFFAECAMTRFAGAPPIPFGRDIEVSFKVVFLIV